MNPAPDPAADDQRAEQDPGPGAETAGDAYRDNRQQVQGGGAAVMGDVHGDLIVGVSVSEQVLKPVLREGPYPADQVTSRLCGFVEPTSHVRCRKVLDGRVLLLRAQSGTGAGTAGFALLAERHGVAGVTGLDPQADLASWKPKEGRGYLLQGLSPEAAATLNDVKLTALADLLHRAGAHLVVTVGEEVGLPADTRPWQVVHGPPPPREVAVTHLHALVDTGRLTGAGLSTALAHLESEEVSAYLAAHRLPGDGAELAAELAAAVRADRPAATALEGLRLGSDTAARLALDKARHSADSVALLVAVALLPRQDRTVITRFAARLRPLLGEPAEAGPAGERPDRPDVLGPSLADRLAAVGARLLPREHGSAHRHRYPVQRVDFAGRHRPEALLRQLWLDHERLPELVWRTLSDLPHQPGTDLAAGRSIGTVLAHATGPDALDQLAPFAVSSLRWQRRLVAFALGEAAQHVDSQGAVREQLRRWSRSRQVNVRCTVAETCAGTYGLARPAGALRLLDAVLDGPRDELTVRNVHPAVSFALSVLLTEKPNRVPVLDQLDRWLRADGGTQRHAFAAEAVEAMALSTFPLPGRSGPRKVSLADVIVEHPQQALALVSEALDVPDLRESVTDGVLDVEEDPRPQVRAAFPAFLSALAGTFSAHHGPPPFLLRRHRRRSLTHERTV
ncbi:hypothetical protein ACFWIA_20390 [Streptomyces sp. NPDC127068]|uniref:hypothetical protein n=1 Tax=Streptomyces sp. NPDC127068 TaxID=3347127 RepID=UPI003658F79A